MSAVLDTATRHNADVPEAPIISQSKDEAIKA